MFVRADGQRPGTSTNPARAVVTFECGHIVHMPTNIATKYWNDQSIPSTIGAVAACAGCITKRRPNGDLQRVTDLITEPHDETATSSDDRPHQGDDGAGALDPSL